MNRTIISCLLAAAFSLPVFAQQPGQPKPPSPRPPQVPVQPGYPQQGQAAVEDLLPFNVKLRLEGSVFGGVITDQTIATGGRQVVADLVLGLSGEQPVIGTFQVTLTPGEPWQAAVSLGIQAPLESKSGNIEYRSLVLRSTVRIAPGKKVVLWEKGDQKLTLSMDQEKE